MTDSRASKKMVSEHRFLISTYSLFLHKLKVTHDPGTTTFHEIILLSPILSHDVAIKNQQARSSTPYYFSLVRSWLLVCLTGEESDSLR
ncbi:hypothetical protein E1B28_011868 [Marasmius oreades]|uniref:Uncharacterized protein n=1 Tax=Marasmius oreades TaxID=181124 RepID=A0A9P7URN3_9AGAR|nr:uncharacterized protein E1B28_011868 [Marasmius oreades]KAG7090271.1 hypothetical protein E1B28_011868 [Marasmius oreades]